MSGGNKLLSGTFPQGLADSLSTGIQNNPNGWYVTFLQQLVLPHSVFFGYLVEWTEVIVGLILLSGALMLLGRPRVRGEAQYGLAASYCIAVAAAAAVSAFMNINFHFWMGGWVFPAFDPTSTYNESIDLDALLPPLSLVILIANLALFKALSVVNAPEPAAQAETVQEVETPEAVGA